MNTLPATCLFAQSAGMPSFEMKVITTANGLCNGNVRGIVKDKTGYLWIATANGLSRYDGHFFTNFFHEPSDTASLGHNFIQGILADKAGNIWVLHVMGLSFYHAQKSGFINYPIKLPYPHFSGTYFCFKLDMEGNIWIGNHNGLGIFNIQQKKYLTSEEINAKFGTQELNLGQACILGMAVGQNGDIWFNTNQRIYKWNSASRQTSTIEWPPLEPTNPSLNINRIDTLQGEVYCGTYTNGLFIYNYNSKTWKHINNGPAALRVKGYDPVKTIQPYSGNLQVFINDLGIGFYDKYTQILQSIDPVPLRTDCVLQNVFTDEKRLWICTDNGLLLLTPKSNDIVDISPPNSYQGAFNTVQVNPLQQTVLSGNYSTLQVYELPETGGLKTDIRGISGLLRYYFISQNGTAWLSTENQVYRKGRLQHTWEKVMLAQSQLNETALLTRNFAEDATGGIWLRVRNAGLYKFDNNTMQLHYHSSPAKSANAIYSGLSYDKVTHTLWVSEENTGLYAFNVMTKSWEHHPLQFKNTKLTPAKILVDKEGSIVFPDPFNGIGLYKPNTKQVSLISQNDGLLSNNVSSIDMDALGNYWTFSAEGITKIMAKTHVVTNLKHDRLNKIQEIACGNNDKIYIATANGLYSLKGSLLNPEVNKGKLIIDRMEVMGKPWLLESKITLPPGSNNIRVWLSYINFFSADAPVIEYRLDEETEWKLIGSQNSISFSRLSAGSYKLTVRAKNQTNPDEWQQLYWTIEKPWWQKTWVIVLAVGLAGSIIYAVIYKRIKDIRQKSVWRQKIYETEMAALQAQMNPHFLFNALNSIDAMVQDGDKYNATTYLNKFARLIRNVLDGSRQKTVSLRQDMDSLKLYLELESMRLDNSFDWTIEISDELLNMDIKIPSLIIQPYVENAIIHGIRHLQERRGKINISYSFSGNTLTTIISDNGKGRAFSQTLDKTKAHSYGMAISQSRIEHFNYLRKGSINIIDLTNERGDALGTRVEVLLPVT